jgi:hypothetical protein
VRKSAHHSFLNHRMSVPANDDVVVYESAERAHRGTVNGQQPNRSGTFRLHAERGSITPLMGDRDVRGSGSNDFSGWP